MDNAQFEHYFMLVHAVFILHQDSITAAEIKLAEKFVHRFVELFPIYYHTKFMNSNVHALLLLHLPLTVKRLGPLFECTCFPWEALNGIIKAWVLGSRYPERKIIEFFVTVQMLALYRETLEPGTKAHTCSQKLKNFKKPKVLEKIDEATGIMGDKFNKTSLNLEQLITDAFANSSLDLPKQGEIFSRLKAGNKVVYTSKIHKRGTNLSYCVAYRIW